MKKMSKDQRTCSIQDLNSQRRIKQLKKVIIYTIYNKLTATGKQKLCNNLLMMLRF